MTPRTSPRHHHHCGAKCNRSGQHGAICLEDRSAGSARVCRTSLFEAVEQPDGPLFEDRTIILRAESEDEVIQRAKVLRKGRQHAYKNAKGDLVSWELRAVHDVRGLFGDRIHDGAEASYEFLDGRAARRILDGQEAGRLTLLH